MLNDASVASAGSYVRACRRIRNSKKIATIRDFHQNICVNPTNKIGLTYNIFILASDGVILSRALSGQQIRVVLQSWSATFTHNFDAQFGAILRTFSA